MRNRDIEMNSAKCIIKHLHYYERKTAGLIQLNYNLHNYTTLRGRVGGEGALPGKRSLGSLNKCNAFNYSIKYPQKYFKTSLCSLYLIHERICYTNLSRS